jgi:hypothetical protein
MCAFKWDQDSLPHDTADNLGVPSSVLFDRKLKLVVLFLSSAALISGVEGVCVEWDHSRCPNCGCCPVTCHSGYSNTDDKTGCTEVQTHGYPTNKALTTCSMTICDTGCGPNCSRECSNGRMLPPTPNGIGSSRGTCSGKPLGYTNRRCYEDRVCKTISGSNSHDDGVCVSPLCSADYRVENNECVACPTGYANEAEDDPSGSDTVCDMCADKFYVSAIDTCTACPGTSTRPYGDDNSVGGITTCSCTSFTPYANVDISGSSCADGLLDIGETCTGYSCISDAYDPSGLEGIILCGDSGLVTNTAICSVCSANHYVSGPGTCTPCPGDSTRLREDNNSAGETTSCSCGTFTAALNLDILLSSCSSGAIDVGNTCSGLRCPDGYLLEGSISCDSSGMISNTAVCGKCAENYYVSAPGVCTSCPGSATNEAGDDNTAGSTTQCGCAVTPSDSRVLLTQSSCSEGKVQTGAECTSLICQNGYELSGSISCAPITQGAQVIDSAGCAACSTDYFVSAPGVCSQCPPSTTNVAGDDNRLSATKCDCTFSPWSRVDLSQSSCSNQKVMTESSCSVVSCVEGYVLIGEISCDSSGSVTNDAVCTSCAENYHVSVENTCTSCPTGYGNEAGDSLGSGVTLCKECLSDYYVSALGMCSPCPGNTKRASGDDNTAETTACFCSIIAEFPINDICDGALQVGSTCEPGCENGYNLLDEISCESGGSHKMASCEPNPCDASEAPEHGAVGDCTASLASGSTCQPTCEEGYSASGTSSCLLGTLTAAT